MALLFDGKAFALEREREIKDRVFQLEKQGKALRIHTITFKEDAGSALYTRLKQQVAQRVGIAYEPQEFSLTSPLSVLLDSIQSASKDETITGVMIQKPSKQVWTQVTGKTNEEFGSWWKQLTNAIQPSKDIDCLSSINLDRIFQASAYSPTFLLPATVRACNSILAEARTRLHETEADWKKRTVLVIGRSDIVGKPLAKILELQGHEVHNVGKDLSTIDPSKFSVVISAVGIPNLVTGAMIVEGAVVVDVGAPQGDVERSTVETKAAFLTPVPGGVGPVTIVSLLDSCIAVANSK